MYRHWIAIHSEMDDQRAREVECLLVRLRAEAMRRVPEWTPEVREEFRRTHPAHAHT
jgi:hypothetical protein